MKKWKEQDIHHLIGKCNKQWANTEHKDNKVVFSKTRHQGLNSLFQTLQCPHEQLGFLRELYDGVLSDSAKELLDTLLELPKHKFYREELLKKRF